MNNTFPFLLHIGLNYFISCPNIIAIFNAKEVDDILEHSSIKETIIIDEKRPVRSYIYCIGGYLVGSPIEAKTLKGRYEEFQNEVNNFYNNFLKII